MMDFKQALHIVCKDSNLSGQMCDPFALRCFLEDKCNWSLEQKAKVKLFYQVDKQYNVFCRLYQKGKSEVDVLLAEFEEQQNEMSKQKFASLLNTIVFLFDASESQLQKVEQQQRAKKQPQVANKKPHKPCKNNHHAKANARQNRIQPVNQFAVSAPSHGFDVVDFLLNLLAAYVKFAPLLAVLFSVVVLIFKIEIPWVTWQWVIGVTVIAILLFLIAFMIDNDCFATNGGVIYFLTVMSINVVLLCFFGAFYKVIFLCVLAQTIFCLAMLAFVSFYEHDMGYGIFFVIALLGCLAGFVWVVASV
ncbi:MAG: hypothetical protein IJV77_07200 [Clostridia bacterium]|nr:hypothetical protein [Clostridia bacterium]